MWLKVKSPESTDEQPVLVTGERFVIGRDEDCDLVVADPAVSRRHAYLKPRPDGRATVHDLDSSNGTWVDGRQVRSSLLSGGEQLRLGNTVLISVPPEEAPERPAAEGPVQVKRGRPAAGARQSQSLVHRIMLQRSVRRATLLGAAAVAIAATVGALLATGAFEEEPLDAVVERVAPSTVLVEPRRGEERAGTGSGWVLDAKQGLIVTNAHVVNSGSRFRVGVGDELRKAEVVGSAPCEDLAVLQVADPSGLKTLPLGSQSELRLGEPVVAVGFPGNASLSSKLTSTTGVVSVVRSTYREPAVDVPVYPNVVQTDAAINPGSSGGPLVDADGKLVGVNSAGRTRSADGRIIQGQNYAVGVDRVKKITAVLRQGRSIGWIGMGLEYPAPGSATGGLESGLLVTHAVEGTGAAEAGFGKRPLMVTAVNGIGLDRSLASYCDTVRDIPSGKSAVFTVRAPAGGRERKVRVRFE